MVDFFQDNWPSSLQLLVVVLEPGPGVDRFQVPDTVEVTDATPDISKHWTDRPLCLYPVSPFNTLDDVYEDLDGMVDFIAH